MKSTPEGWPRLSVAVFYTDPRAAIEWIVRAFGFETRVVVDDADGGVAHSQLIYGDALIMIGTAGRQGREWCQSPATLGGANTHAIALFVDDADAHCENARAAGAIIATEPMTQDHGADYWADRIYEAVDPEGHHWWFMQRLRG